MSRTKSPRTQPQKPRPFSGFIRSLAISLFVIVLLAGLASRVAPTTENTNTATTMTNMVVDINAAQITAMEIRDQKVTATYSDKSTKTAYKEPESSLTEQLVALGANPQILQTIPITITTNTGFGYWAALIIPFALPIVILTLLVYFFMRQIRGANSKTLAFGQSNARMSDPEKQNVTFADVAGNTEAKQELEEVVDFLKNPKKYIAIGAKIPRGVLLSGAPGTGKTLLARAVAGEAGVPFFHLSGSEFVEMFVGVGASRVRDLFATAKKVAPTIVFIDEIDAVGRHRGVGIGGGNDEREQTLNQILVEMDGFEPNEAVIVIAATNRPDVLDEALLRPGRFDRRVVLDVPDRQERLEILRIHALKKKLAQDIDLAVVASRTPGFSGADLESLMNEGAIRAARAQREVISQDDILLSIEKVMMGPEKKNRLQTSDERRLVAYHEAGHAVLASVLPHADPVHKVTIIPRGFAGGYTLNIPIDEKRLKTSAEYRDQLTVMMGGMAAEKIINDDITPGAGNDIENATSLARSMVTKWGMSEAVGPVAIEHLRRHASFGEAATASVSPDTLTVVDREIRELLEHARHTAVTTLHHHRKVLDEVAEQLLERETLERAEFEVILTKFGIPLKQSSEAVA